MSKKYVVLAAVLLALVAGTAYGAKVILSNNSNSASSAPKPYVALGDSVAAGIGLPEYSDSSACNRTTQSYPNILADAGNYQLTNLSCSGATIEQGIDGAQTVQGLSLPAQLDALSELPKPTLITITIGANDINWTKLLRCYTEDCASETSQAEDRKLLGLLMPELGRVLLEINTRYDFSPPRVLLTGYYNIASTSNENCSDTNGIAAAEKTYISEVISLLNKTIEVSAAGYEFATYVPIDFANHELCANEPWIQGIRDKAPFHPNETGHKAIASQLMAIIRREE